jgi:predicted DNA-binding protein
MFVLTARPAESAPAIFEFLQANGLNIPLENITGLANSTAEAKAAWMVEKVADGYNDFYFADDAIQNVKAVQDVLDQFDIKSKVQQAKADFVKGDPQVVKLLEESSMNDVKGVDRLDSPENYNNIKFSKIHRAGLRKNYI